MASQQFRGNFVGSYRTTEVFQASRKMIELIQLGSAIQDFMEERQWRFCFIGGLTFEERAVERSSKFEYEEGFSLRTCSAEDLLVMKAFAARDQDWVDVAGIVTRQGDKLNWSRIWDELKPLVELKGSPEILTRLKSVQRQEFE